MFSPRLPRPWLIGLSATLLTAGCLVAIQGQAAQPWQLQDLRPALTSRSGAILSLANRGTDWLVSDGANLWSVAANGDVTDYSDKARESGTVAALGSDGTDYLIGWNQGNQTRFTKTNLTNWSPVDGPRFNDRTIQVVHGANGRWFVTSEDRSSNGSLPRTWSVTGWHAGSIPETLLLPNGASSFVAGCFKESSGASVCTGRAAFVPLQNEWYLIAGGSETRSADGRTQQEASTRVWRWKEGSAFEEVDNAPKARFVSGVWKGDNQLLLATTNAVTNPFAADMYWTFDGRSFRAYQEAPLAAGLLSVDTRSVTAAWNGQGWTMTAGKSLIRFERGFFQVEGTLRDIPTQLAGSTNGATLLAGKRGTFDDVVGMTNPNEPSLILIKKTVTNDQSASLIRPLVSQDPNSITTFTLNATPGNATISNGSSFTFRATAHDEDGIERVDIFVHNAKIKSCDSDSCSYTQTFWTTQPTSTETLFFARAYDRRGNVTDSQLLRLTVKNEPVNDATLQVSGEPGRMPAGLRWEKDGGSGVSYTLWSAPSSTTTALYANDLRALSVAAMHTSGIDRIEFWVNGRVERTCSDEEAGMSFCQVPLLGRNYPIGTEVFVNARILTKSGREAWTSATRLQRQ